MIKHSLDIPIYAGRLHIAITGDFCKDINELNKYFNQEFDVKDEVLGMSQQRGGHTLIIINEGKHKRIFKKKNQFEYEMFATIVHEAKHSVNQIFISKGIQLDLNNDEPECYLLDWIVKEIFKVYFKFKEQNVNTI